MTGRKTNLSKTGTENLSGNVIKGRRCQVCTGCGLCPGVRPASLPQGIRILTKGGLDTEVLSLANKDGIRLIATDIGTTTIAMELCEEDGSARERYVTVNPQTQVARDVISRIEAARTPAVRQKMQEMVKSALTEGTERFLKCLKPGERPCMIIAANTTMSYLLMGWDPRELGEAPFAARHLGGASFMLEASGERVPCILLPGFSAFVGGDLYAGIAACSMDQAKELTLLVDLGTNGEILLGNCDGILGTATAAGPAFEGGASSGIFGADLLRCLATLRSLGYVDETGLLAEPYFSKGIRIGNILMTQDTIRALQMAKSAVSVGIEILLEQSGHAVEEIGRVVLAGGFGYFLNPADAVAVGLLPEALLEKTVSGGNTALAGAKKLGGALLKKGWPSPSESEGSPLEGLYHAKIINLAMEEQFRDKYFASMALSPKR